MLLSFDEWFTIAKQLYDDYGAPTNTDHMVNNLGIISVTLTSKDVMWIQFITEEHEVFFNLKYMNRQYD